MIHLKDVYKAFGEKQILRGVELAVYPGETVCIIGGSGTGKSVSLKHIMRLLDPDSGRSGWTVRTSPRSTATSSTRPASSWASTSSSGPCWPG